MPDKILLVQTPPVKLLIVNPEIVHRQLVIIGIQGPAGPQGEAELVDAVRGETPMGLINGSNAVFTTEFSFVPESVEVIVNGLDQDRGVHFTTLGTTTINLMFSPEVGDTLLVNYIKGD